MPTTNISQILFDVIKHVHFARKEQKRFILRYSSALFFANYKNTIRLAKLCCSQSSVWCCPQWCKVIPHIIEKANKRNNFCCGNYSKIQQCKSQACFSQYITRGQSDSLQWYLYDWAGDTRALFKKKLHRDLFQRSKTELWIKATGFLSKEHRKAC